MTTLQLAPPPAEAERPITPELRRRRRKWPFAVMVVLAVLAVALPNARSWFAASSTAQGVEWVPARRAEIEDTVTALGKLQPRQYVDVGAQVSGQLQSVAVAVGDRVKAGDLLAEIDPRLQLAKLEADRAQLAQLAAEREVQKLQAEFAAGEYQRQLRLKGDGVARDDVFARTLSEMRITTAKRAAIDAEIQQVESTTKADAAQLSFTRIFAPIAGTVVSVDARAGQTLIANQQAPILLRIADLSAMTVWTQVAEADVTRLKPGMPLYFTTLGHGSRRWTATVRKVLPAPMKTPVAAGTAPAAPSANAAVFYSVLFDVDNVAGELLPDMSAQVFFVVRRASDAVVVPTRALHDLTGDEESPSASVSVVTDDGRVEVRKVKVGIHNHFEAQILEGIAVGEHVVKNVAHGSDDEDSSS